MKLLIITQVIDIDHPILGFFHRWVEEFALHCEHVHVICLQAGTHHLPANVTVHSLGKEAGKGKLAYFLCFYTLIWSLRHEYDQVFVHMNQMYVILGAPLWRMMRKKVGLWYAHGAVSPSLHQAVKLADVVFTSTPEGLRIETPKKHIVGQGIDTSVFTTVEKRQNQNSVLRLITVGRISTSKNLPTLIKTCAELKKAGVEFIFTIVGTPLSESEVAYKKDMEDLVKELNIPSNIEWIGAIPNYQLPAVLQTADIFIHDGSTNSLDKTLVEAALCGCVVISSNPAYKGVTESVAPEYLYLTHDYKALSEIIIKYPQYTENMSKVKTYFKENFSISNLISGIVSRY